MMRNLLIVAFIFSLSFSLKAQEGDSTSESAIKPVQISGLVLSGDSIPRPIPFTHVYIANSDRGTMTDKDGFFSIAVKSGDSLRFSCLGFRKEDLSIPDTLTKTGYLARIVMERDTTLLEEVTLYPWPRPDQFKEAFLATNVPTTKNDIAMRNLAIQALQDRAAAMNLDPDEAKDLAIMMQNQSIYDYGRYQGFGNGGTAILGALTNPFAWQRLFQSFKKN